MTRADYVLLAEAIRKARDDVISKEPECCTQDLLDGIAYAAEHVADALQSDNKRFRRDFFLTACGINGK